jgi:peptide/nickel transport system substrate-binding protein
MAKHRKSRGELFASLAATVASVAFLATPANASEADDTLRLAWGGGAGPLETANVYFTNSRTGIWLAMNVWDALVYRNPETMQYEPLLAEGWEQIDDLTLEFKLRQGVKFHNGEAFDANDVVATINWAVDPASGVLKARETAWIDRAEKVDDHTVRIISKKVFPVALDYLTTLPIYPDEYMAAAGRDGMAANPVGTGPYKVAKLDPTREYHLQANADYSWGSPKQAPKIGNVIIREIQDLQTQVAELVSGGIDLSADIQSDQAAQLKNMSGLTVTTGETMRISYLGLDATGRSGDKYLSNLNVRQAINLGFNREAYRKALFGDHARNIHVSCYPSQFGCDDTNAVRYEFNPEKAKKLLADAGFADGIEISLFTVPSVWVDPIVADLAKIGITLKVNAMPWGSLSPKITSGEVPILADNHGSYSLNDASASIGYFFGGGPNDYSRDAEVTQWLAEAEATMDPEARKALYAKAIAKVTSQAYHVPMSSHVRHYVHSDKLAMTPSGDEILRLFEYSWSK